MPNLMDPRQIDGVLLTLLTQPGPNIAYEFEQKRAIWCQTVASVAPGTNADVIRSTASAVMAAAQRLGTMSPIDPVKLVPFFLRCTLNWILEGKATVHNVVDRLPRTIDELGLMTVAEQINPMTGQKLTAADLKAAQKGGKLKLQ